MNERHDDLQEIIDAALGGLTPVEFRKRLLKAS